MNKEATSFLNELYKRMPIDENHPYFNLGVEQFYRKYRSMFEFYEDNYKELLSVKKDTKILDVGFGFGMFLFYMKKNGFESIHGVEYDQNQVNNAKKMGFHAELISDLSNYLRNNYSQFDLIHACNVVEHFPKYDLIEVFDLFHNSLRKGGKLIVVVPNIASWRGIYDRYKVLGHEIGFSETSLEQLFDVTHFNNIKVTGSQTRFRLRIKHILMRISQKIFNIIIGFIDYLYLGMYKPRCLNQFLIGTGIKKQKD